MSTLAGYASSFTRSTKVIAVADVVESVRLMEQDEAAFIRLWRGFLDFVMQRLPQHAGRYRKSLGDGVMLEFSDPEGCIRAALAMRDWFGTANRDLGPEDHVHLRIGAHLAEFVADAYDIYGTDVNLAARIASLAGPGEIVISAALRNRLGPALRPQLEDLGTCHLKHVRQPVHAFRIGAAGRAPVIPASSLRGQSWRPTLVVLPFAMQGEAPDGISGETLADDVVASLADAGHVQLVSRLSTGPMQHVGTSLPGLRHALAAQYVLDGRARRRGEQLGLHTELCDAGNGHVVWAHSFHGTLKEVGALDGALMREVVSAVHSAVAAHELDRAQARALPAMDGSTLLLSAVTLMHSLLAPDTDRARSMLEHLVERWPRHAVPHAWLAHLHVLLLQQGARRTGASARVQANMALQCDSTSPLARAVAGRVALHVDHDADAAQDQYAQALSAHPDDAFALVLETERLAWAGSGEAARAMAQRSLEACPIAPLRALHDGILALALLAAGDVAEALRCAQRSVNATPSSLAAQAVLAAAQVERGAEAQARRTVARLLQRVPDESVETYLARTPSGPLRTRIAEALARAGLPPG